MRTFILGAFLMLTGCHVPLGESTKGELGRVSFEYSSGRGCFFGCGLETPMLRGTEETLYAHGPASLRAGKVAVEPQGLLQIADIDSRTDEDGEAARGFKISALGAGDVQLSLANDKGELIDRVVLKVRDPARLTAEWSNQIGNRSMGETTWYSTDTVRVSGKDGTALVQLSAFDASGLRLQASTGMEVTVSDPRIVAVSSLPSESYLLELRALATGSATLTAKAKNGVSAQLTVTTD
jgi:hypothetical protein